MKQGKKDCSRREFIIRGVGGAVAAGLAGLNLKGQVAAKGTGAVAQVAETGKTPITRVLGKTGIRLPIVSMGVMNADNPALVRRSFELGIRHFDTAAGYQKGRNEEMVGSVLRELKARDQAVIATKIHPASPEILDQMGDKLIEEDFLARLDQSLGRLQTDHVDILYIHSIKEAKELKRPGLLAAIDKAKKAGKARFVGFSTHNKMAECLEAAVPMNRFDVILTVINYSLADSKEMLEAMARAAKAGIGLVAMKTQCRQAWSQESKAGTRYDEGSVWQTALLKWALRLESVTTAIPGYTTFKQLETDWPVAFDLEYTPDESAFLADPGVKLAMALVCRQCGGCAGSCPRGVDVPALVRAHMYAADYGNFHEMRRALDEIAGGRGLPSCLACGECRAACVRGVPLARRLEELKAIFA